MPIILPYNWRPRPYQEPVWLYLRTGGLRAVVCAHRRWGKDEVALHHTACAVFERRANYGHMLPQYAQARKAIWDAVNPHTGARRIDEAFPPQSRSSTHEQEMKITFKPDGNGHRSTWQVLGSDNFNSLMGTAYAGITKSEEALSDPAAWGYLSPILRENNGWALFISTPRGHNHFERLLKTATETPGWYGEVSTIEMTKALNEIELQEELRMLQDVHGDDYGYALWRQEYFCSFDAAIPGAIWADCVQLAEEQGRICDFPVLRTTPTYTAWDLGRTDDTAIWFFQFNGGMLDVIDHHSSSMKDIPFYVDLLKSKGYTYVTHYLPHDARPRTLAAGGKSILQQLQEFTRTAPLGRFVIGPRLDVQEGIQAARRTFPKCRFHATACSKGLTSLRQYHREWDDEKKVFRDTPEHDWSSHDADAFRYLSLAWKPARPGAPPEAPLVERLLAGSPTKQTMGDLRKRHLAKRRAEREAGVR